MSGCSGCWSRLVAVALCVLVLVVAVAVVAEEVRDFLAENALPDGERETRVVFGGIWGKEVAVGEGHTPDIKFRQITDTHRLLHLIYRDGENLKDCEIVDQKDQVAEFLKTFKDDLRYLMATSNLTIESLDDGELPQEVASWFNVTHLVQKCQQLHQEMRKEIGEHQRHKRDVSDLLRMPGTRWCGKGYSADKYTRLGGFSRTDKCCRRHDLSCRFWIGAFETKYELFNWRINTIMHCSCDERFRACLKMVGSSDANLVGKLFFNVVQTQCFVIKPKKVCKKRGWWGRCEKHKHVKQAILRSNLPY